jgi:hypothetical protein
MIIKVKLKNIIFNKLKFKDKLQTNKIFIKWLRTKIKNKKNKNLNWNINKKRVTL